MVGQPVRHQIHSISTIGVMDVVQQGEAMDQHQILIAPRLELMGTRLSSGGFEHQSAGFSGGLLLCFMSST